MYIENILFVTQGQCSIELTHTDLYFVACRLTSKADIRRLGLKLGVKDHTIDTIFCNQKGDITEAAYETLKEWRKGQEDAKVARITLRNALTHPDIKLHQVAQEGLKFDFIEGKQWEVLKIGPWDLCWFKRWRIYLLCFFAIGSKFVDISFAGVFDIFWTFLTHFS